MPSGADLEYARLLAAAGINPVNAQGYDGAILEQIDDSNGSGIEMAAEFNNLASVFRIAADARYDRKRALDPRDFGAVGNGVTDDTAAIQACINAAGIGGAVELPALTFKISASLVLPSGLDFRGVNMKTSILLVTTDITAITFTGGGNHGVRQLKVWNTWTGGARTKYDIDVINPTKPVFEDVEVDIAGAGGAGGGGIRFRYDSGQPGNAFMPMLSRIWIRQGTLMIDGVTDGHFVDGFVWAQDLATAAIHAKDIGLWTFVGVDVVPSDGAGSGYFFENAQGAMIVGGYVDGSYVDNLTGYGIRCLNSKRILVTGHTLYSNGRNGVYLDNSHGCTFSAVSFQSGNKQNNFYYDIELNNASTYNSFVNTTHIQQGNRSNKGGVYKESAGSTNNLIDYATVNQSEGNFYAALYFDGNEGTQGNNNRPRSLWPRPVNVPDFITPPASLVAVGANATWPVANRAYFHRFSLTLGGFYSGARLRTNVQSGNIRVAVVKLVNGAYTRVMDSGTIACPLGNVTVSMGNTYISAGDYALVLWCDNTTASFVLLDGSEALRTSTLMAELDLPGSIPPNGNITWNSSRAVAGFTLIK